MGIRGCPEIEWEAEWLTPCGPKLIALLNDAVMPPIENELLKALLLWPPGPEENALEKLELFPPMLWAAANAWLFPIGPAFIAWLFAKENIGLLIAWLCAREMFGIGAIA